MLNSSWLEECHAAAWLQPCLLPLPAKTWLGCILLNLSLPHDNQGVLVTMLEMPSGVEGKLGVAIYMFMDVPRAAKGGTIQCDIPPSYQIFHALRRAVPAFSLPAHFPTTLS